TDPDTVPIGRTIVRQVAAVSYLPPDIHAISVRLLEQTHRQVEAKNVLRTVVIVSDQVGGDTLEHDGAAVSADYRTGGRAISGAGACLVHADERVASSQPVEHKYVRLVIIVSGHQVRSLTSIGDETAIGADRRRIGGSVAAAGPVAIEADERGRRRL